MGGKQLFKGNSILFHLAIGLGVMVFLSGCQSVELRTVHKEPEYVTAFQYLERVQSLMGQEEYTSALAENAKLESHYDYTESRSGDYDRVIRMSARMNTSFLKKVIQDEKKLFNFSKKVGQQDLITEKLNAEIDKLNAEMDKSNAEIHKLTRKLQELDTALKTVERLETENKTLQRQIKDFKKIDLEGAKINADIK